MPFALPKRRYDVNIESMRIRHCRHTPRRCTYMIVRILRTRLRVQQHNKRAFSSIMADIPVYDKHYINGQCVGTLSEKKDEFIEVFDSSVGKRFRDYVF